MFEHRYQEEGPLIIQSQKREATSPRPAPGAAAYAHGKRLVDQLLPIRKREDVVLPPLLSPTVINYHSSSGTEEEEPLAIP